MKKNNSIFTVVTTVAFITIACHVLSTPTTIPPSPQPSTQAGLFKLVKTVQVTPDDQFPDGAGGYIHYVPATDRFVIIMTTNVKHPYTLSDSEVCEERVIGYKEYTADMQPTGKHGYIACGWGDATSNLIGNNLFVVRMAGGPAKPGQAPWIGWMLWRFDAVTWKKLGSAEVHLDFPTEQNGGPTISYVNGQVVVTGEYRLEGTKEGAPGGGATHNNFFTRDLEPAGKLILRPPKFPPHYCEVSILQQSDGDILIFASNTPRGDLIVLRLDKDWNFKEQKTLRKNAYFPTGTVTDGRYLYVAYTDTSTIEPGMMMEGQNIRLAAFDADWNVIQDVTVLDAQKTANPSDYGESPWITMHGNYLYVSYLISRMDPKTHELIDNQTYVNVYELTSK